MASFPDPIDIPSPIDFHDPAQARAWVESTVARRPWRPRFFQAFVAALNDHFPEPFSVAELGSGPGHLAAAVLRGCDVASYAALDLSPAMHELAREHLGQDAGRVAFLLQDFRRADWPAAVGQVDAVVTIQAAHEVRHKSRLPALLEGVGRCLRPAGLFLFCDHYAEEGSAKHAQLYPTRDEQPASLAAAGFVDVRLLLDHGGMALYSARRP